METEAQDMAQHVEKSHGHDDSTPHVLPAYIYYRTFAVLMVFLLLTVTAAYIDLSKALPIHIPGANIIVMLGIAMIKGTFVVMFFMHVLYGTKLTWLWAAAGFVWFVIMFGLFIDYFTRNWGAFGWQS